MQGDEDEYAGSEDLVTSLFDTALGDLERRRALERVGRTAAGIEIDLEDGGPLAQYVKLRRSMALEAIQGLAQIDPKDPVSIATLQADVREYLRVCEWVTGRMEEAAEAERIIEREYGEQQDADESQ